MEPIEEQTYGPIGKGIPTLSPPRMLHPRAPVSHRLLRGFTRFVFQLVRALKAKRTEGLPIETDVIFKLARMGGDVKKISVTRLRRLYNFLTIPFHMDAPTMGSVEEYDISEDVSIRVYKPKSLPTPSPALLYFHGGGCVIGSTSTHDIFCRNIAESASIAVASVNYRLAPESRFPAQIIDTRAAYLWLCDNSEALGIDASRMGMAGDSAGAYLAILLALSRIGTTPSPAYLALIYPFLDPGMNSASAQEDMSKLLLNRATMERFIGWISGGDIDLKSPAINPLQHPDIGHLPPSLVVTAQFDPLRDEGLKLVKRVKAGGGAVTHVHEMRLYHEFISMGGVVPEAKQAIDKITMWIKSQAHSKAKNQSSNKAQT